MRATAPLAGLLCDGMMAAWLAPPGRERPYHQTRLITPVAAADSSAVAAV